MIFKVKYEPNDAGDWIVQKLNDSGIEVISTNRYKKVTFRRPVTTELDMLVTKATMVTESEGSVTLEF